MLIKIPHSSEEKESNITDEKSYINRRNFILGSLVLGTSTVVAADTSLEKKLTNYINSDYGKDESITPYDVATKFNNFYEFGTHKDSPAQHAHKMITNPWTVTVDGLIENPGQYQLNDFIAPYKLQERIYRLRCVEAWSMVIPWLGFPLKNIIDTAKPTSNAKYVYFETLKDKSVMPDVASKFAAVDYPYVEGLRMDEAMHDLTILAVGMYGKQLTNQNGAPLRLIVPWKYGFKSIKSIVKISFVEHMPHTTWVKSNSKEYGFYANVNPNVNHPRWSQATERRLPAGIFSSNKIDTRVFNGYDQVADMYSGMDLSVNY